jgi:hypothetical protein
MPKKPHHQQCQGSNKALCTSKRSSSANQAPCHNGGQPQSAATSIIVIQQHNAHAPKATTATTNHHDPTSANCYLLLLLMQCSVMLWHTLQVLGNCVKFVVQDGVAFMKGSCRGPGWGLAAACCRSTVSLMPQDG